MRLGKKAFAQGHYDDAQKNFLQAQGEAKKFQAVDKRLASTLDSLAKVSRRLGRFQDAGIYFAQSLAIKENDFGKTSPELEGTLFAYADLLRVEGNYSQAED